MLLLGFTEALNPPTGNWYQQFMPSIGNRQIADITFLDSLTGYTVTNSTAQNDTAYVFKTTNGGNNWFLNWSDSGAIYTRVEFINQNTGFVGGGIVKNLSYYILKTTNAGTNWFYLNAPFQSTYQADMSLLNSDTIWTVEDESLTGGVFYTTNGGINWTVQYSAGTNNPNHIYMYNARIGYISIASSSALRRTTNGGANWTQLTGTDGFSDMHFVDSLTGWKCIGNMKKTTDGGLTWVLQTLPSGGIIFSNSAVKMSFIGRDIIWAVGGEISFPNSQIRGILFRTTNSGQNWLFQIPDTSIHLLYGSVQFINSKTGWAYGIGQFNPTGGIHTTNGGDSNWLTGLYDIGGNIPKDYDLYQNYPNPFNPVTNIKYQIVNNVRRETSNVRLIVFDLIGREVIVLVNQQQRAGTYQVDFSGNDLSSGIYFYSLYADNKLINTRKMILLK